MPDKQRDVAEKVLSGMSKKTSPKICETCGSDDSGNEYFQCESCSKPICSSCHKMTNDFEMICQDCVSAKGLTADDLQF